MKKTVSLRARLTLLTIGLVTVLSTILTFSSVYNAGNIFGQQAAVNDNNPVSNSETFLTAEASEDTAANEFRDISVLFLLGGIALGGVLAYIIVGTALQPMRKLNHQIQGISANALNNPVEVPRTGDEVSQIASSFNEMLGRLSEEFEAQQRFASAAAHELKTPLAAIKTNLDVLTVGDTNDETKMKEYEEVYAVIHKQTQRMIKLVDGLLATSSSSSYSLDDTVKLNDMIEDALMEQRAAIEEKGISVKIDWQEEILMNANAAMLYRALSNLIENAVKYNMDGGRLDICLSRQAHLVNLRIENTSFGIGPEHLPHIFEPFYRIDDSRSRKIAGAGLGLAIAKDTIERHSGKIVIESDQSSTVCHVTLPVL